MLCFLYGPGEPGRYPAREPFLRFISFAVIAITVACVGCERTPQLRLEPRTHGYDFVNEHGVLLATATSLEEIETTINKPAVRSKLTASKLSVQFYHVSRGLKGIQGPDGVACQEIVDAYKAALAAQGNTRELEINYDNW